MILAIAKNSFAKNSVLLKSDAAIDMLRPEVCLENIEP